jgi:hypothetical protein
MISPSFNQGIKTLDSGLIDPSKNGQSQDDRGSATAPAFAGRFPEGLSQTTSLAKIQFSSHVIRQSLLTEIPRL